MIRFARWFAAATPLALSSVMASSQTAAAAHTGAERRAMSQAKAPSPLDAVVATLFAAHTFEQAAISPDGKRVAWVERLQGKDGAPTGKTALYVSDVKENAAPRRVTLGIATSAHSEGSVAWSPDSQRIAFLSDVARAGQLQLYVADAAGGAARQLTSVKGFVSTPGWSPDGRTLAILFTENATRVAGPLAAETVQTGEIREAVTEQRLTLVDVAAGQLRQITPGDMYVYEYDWSPDGKRFAATAAHGSGDDNWYVAELHTIEAATGEMKSIYKPPLQIANPAWSPDGQHIAFIAGIMSDEGVVGNDIFTVDAVGGDLHNLTPNAKSSAAWLRWMPNGKTILDAGYVDGEPAIATVDPAGSRPEVLWHAPEQASSGNWGFTLSVSNDGRSAALIRQSFSTPPEIWAGPVGEWKQITKRNAGLKPAWGEAKSIHWASDTYDVQGWLLYPRNYDASRKYPLVVNVHGGPASMAQSHWPGNEEFAAGLAGMDYFVLYPNPRGSFGQGEAFVRANVKDFGYGDFRDIMAGVDAAARVAPIDLSRVGITGWSYGGYMTMWAVTQTNRFKAAMAGAGISNLQSYYGQNKIDKWMIPYFGASVYDDPAVYAKSSPITFIKNVKTPTLILVGDRDGECPPPQSYEFWHALQTLGVENTFVVYPNEGHMFADPAHQRDVIARTLAWFDAHLK